MNDFAKEIEVIAKSVCNNNPAPRLCTIVKNYDDLPYCDVNVDGFGVLTYRKTVGVTDIGSEGVIIFVDGDLNQGVVITSCRNVDVTELLNVILELNSRITVLEEEMKSIKGNLGE